MRKRRQGSQNNGKGSHDRRTQHLAEALIDPDKKIKLLKICNALNKEMTGLDGRALNLNTLVRFGINGFTFKEITELL